MRQLRKSVPWLAAVPCAVLLLSACAKNVQATDAADASTTNRAVAPASWSSQRQPMQYKAGGIRLDPPPSGVSPAHSFLEAFATCQTASACPNSGQPTVTLALYSNDQHADIQPDNSAKPDIQNRLAWVMTWKDQPCTPAGPSGASLPPTTCVVLVFVDANTNKDLGTYEEGLPVIPSATPS